MKKRNQINGKKFFFVAGALVLLELLVFLVVIFNFSEVSYAGVGGNVTVKTYLEVGTVSPEILTIIINGGNSINLLPNQTYNVSIRAYMRDFNNESNFKNVSVRFFDVVSSSYASLEDNNNHYRENNCFLNLSYGDIYEAEAICTIPVWYYAYNSTWNASVLVYDNDGLSDFKSNISTINTLLAVGLPDSINYGVVNSTYVSSEVIANVTNFGNVAINLSLRGYAIYEGDNLSMNCSLGTIKNISIHYEKYNLTSSNTSQLSLAQFESIYTNLTSYSVVKAFNLNSRQNDIVNEAINATYWRIYVPVGVAGTCQGNIVFGAVNSPGT